jgi:hypothetical protein
MEEEEELSSPDPETPTSAEVISDLESQAETSSGGKSQLVGEILITGSSLINCCDDDPSNEGAMLTSDYEAMRERESSFHEEVGNNTAQNDLTESCTSQSDPAETNTPQNDLLLSSTPPSELSVSIPPQIMLQDSERQSIELTECDIPRQYDTPGSDRTEDFRLSGTSAPDQFEQTGTSRPARHVHIRESIEIHEASDSSR